MHRKEGLMFKNMGQTCADMKKLHEEAAGMPLEDMFMEHIVKPFATRDALSHSLHRLNEDYESLKAENAELRRGIEHLQSKLSRYEQGVIVEGVILLYDNEVHIESDVRDYPVGHGLDIGQRVRVLVMPCEDEEEG